MVFDHGLHLAAAPVQDLGLGTARVDQAGPASFNTQSFVK